MLSPFIYSQLVIIVALGWIVFAEFPDALALVGIAVIAASGVVNAFVQWRSARRS
jgi:drug/metabolite transporter (DMT)-like permease